MYENIFSVFCADESESLLGVEPLNFTFHCFLLQIILSKQFPDIPVISESVRVFGVKDKLTVFISPIVSVVLMAILEAEHLAAEIDDEELSD